MKPSKVKPEKGVLWHLLFVLSGFRTTYFGYPRDGRNDWLSAFPMHLLDKLRFVGGNTLGAKTPEQAQSLVVQSATMTIWQYPWVFICYKNGCLPVPCSWLSVIFRIRLSCSAFFRCSRCCLLNVVVFPLLNIIPLANSTVSHSTSVRLVATCMLW